MRGEIKIIYILYAILSVLLCFIVHEGAHYITSVIFGHPIKFEFKFGKIFNIPLIPRYVWYMPNSFTKLQKKIVAGAGFTIEILFSAILPFIIYEFGVTCLIVALIHLGVYNFYAEESNDFQFFKD